jgi:glyoxylase-like metal-dependent hydrolase (beta-lactamase superfamily II)
MMAIERYDDVTRVRLAGWGSRLVGLDVSTYLVRGVLVDTGFSHVADAIARLCDERRPAGVMITHYHEDHAGNAELLAARGLPIAMHPETESRLRARTLIRHYRRVVWGTPPALRSPIERYEDRVLQFVPTPGHSTDHQVVWDPERETLFSGDLWLGVRTRVMHHDEDPYRIIDSLRAAIALGPRRMFDAHRGLIPDPVRALRARATFMADTIARIEAKLTAGWSERAIVKSVLGGEESTALFSFGEYARGNFVRAVGKRLEGEKVKR